MYETTNLTMPQWIGLLVLTAVFVGILVLIHCSNNYNLNGIKSKKIGDGQHGTARWATKSEIKKTYKEIPFEPEKWRKGEHLPQIQVTVVGCKTHGKRTTALVDEGDVHTLMVGAAGVGKTAFFCTQTWNMPVLLVCHLCQLTAREMFSEITAQLQKSIMAIMFLCWIYVILHAAMRTIFCIW